jgi:TM2 domain-containing membrane protein YozV
MEFTATSKARKRTVTYAADGELTDGAAYPLAAKSYPLRMSQSPNYGESEPTRPIDPSTPYSSPPAAPSSGGYSYPQAPAPSYGAPQPPAGYGQQPTSGAPGYDPYGQQPTSGAAGYDPNAQQQYAQPGYNQPQPYAQPGYPQQQYAQPGYAQQSAYDPQGRPYSDKSKMAAGLLGIFLGGFGVGRFYTGHTGLGVAQLLVSVFTCGIGSIWGLIDGIMILVNGGTDAEGRVLRD